MKSSSILFSFSAARRMFALCRSNEIIPSQTVEERRVFSLRHLAYVTVAFHLIIAGILRNEEALRTNQTSGIGAWFSFLME